MVELPKQMTALTVVSPKNLEYRTVPVPVPAADQLIIKVKRAGICATDISIFTGDCSFVRSGEITYPVRFGHEWSGEVVSVGSGVTKFKPGDRVYTDNAVSCGVCDECKRGNYGACRHKRSVGTVNCWDGCFADYMLMPEYHVYPLPDSVSYEEGALIEPASIALDAFKEVKVDKNSTVAVVGTGAIGMSSVWIAKYMGAGQVIMVGRQDQKLMIAKELGADAVVNNTREDSIKRIRELTGGHGTDLIIETSGSVQALRDAIYSASGRSRVSLVSFYERNIDDVPIDYIVLRCLHIVGTAGHFGNPQKVCSIMQDNPHHLTKAISHRIKFSEMKDFLEHIDDHRQSKIKVMVDFD